MARLQVLTLPGRDGEAPPFALILDRLTDADLDRFAGSGRLEGVREILGARAVLAFSLDMDTDVVPGSAASEHVRRVVESALGRPVEVPANNPEES